VAPSDPGGKKFAGTGDTSFKVSQGQHPDASLAGSAGTTPPPAAPSPSASPSAAPAATPVSAAPAVDSWWQLYRDPALDSLVQEALANNRDLAVAAAHLQRAQAVLNEAGAARLPDTDVALGGNYGKQNPDQIVAAATHQGAATRWAYAPSLAVSWEVDLWGRVRQLVASAQADAGATQAAGRPGVETTAGPTAAMIALAG